MQFGRKLSYIGHTVCLPLSIRNELCKELYSLDSVSKVKIWDAHPTKCPGANLIAEVDPLLVAPGRMKALWEIPADTCRGIYYDEWNFTVKGIPVQKILQFYVEDDFVSCEEYIKTDYRISMSPKTVFTDSKEYICFKLENPEWEIFPKAQVRITAVSKVDLRFTLNIRTTGPGVTQNNINQLDNGTYINALFPGEPVIIADTTTILKSEFIDIVSYCDTAYFYLNTVDVPPGIYNLQLKLFQGEEEKVLRPIGLRINDIDLSDTTSVFDAVLT